MGLATEIPNQEAFANLKAQKWIEFADKLKITYNAVTYGDEYNLKDIVSFSLEIKDDMLTKAFRELSAPDRELKAEKQIKVESKIDLKKRGIPSPNIADAIIMAFSIKGTVF